LSEDGDDSPGVCLEGPGFEIAEGDCFVEVGVVDALEGADGLGVRGVVSKIVGYGTKILSVE